MLYQTLSDQTSSNKIVEDIIGPCIIGLMCGGLRHNATWKDKYRALSQISSIVRSLTTKPDFCLVVTRRVRDEKVCAALWHSGHSKRSLQVIYHQRWFIKNTYFNWRMGRRWHRASSSLKYDRCIIDYKSERRALKARSLARGSGGMHPRKIWFWQKPELQFCAFCKFQAR